MFWYTLCHRIFTAHRPSHCKPSTISLTSANGQVRSAHFSGCLSYTLEQVQCMLLARFWSEGKICVIFFDTSNMLTWSWYLWKLAYICGLFEILSCNKLNVFRMMQIVCHQVYFCCPVNFELSHLIFLFLSYYWGSTFVFFARLFIGTASVVCGAGSMKQCGVCPSVCLSQHGPQQQTRYWSIAAAAAGKCGQCHVVSVRRWLNTDLWCFPLLLWHSVLWMIRWHLCRFRGYCRSLWT